MAKCVRCAVDISQLREAEIIKCIDCNSAAHLACSSAEKTGKNTGWKCDGCISESSATCSKMDLDAMLRELGQFGRYQAFCFTVIMFPVILCGFRSTEYIFTTMNVPHRCRVPECEGLTGSEEFKTPWVQAAVPFTVHGADPTPQECLRYRPLVQSAGAARRPCSAEMFNRSDTMACDDWVFSEPTKTLATDFNILCPEDQWKLTFLSSIFVITSFIGIPLAGLISDRVGRKTVLVFGCTVLAVTGVIRSFSVSYTMSLILECLDGLMGGAIYAPAFILGLEILSPSKRLLGSLLINVYFALGEVVLALVMWAAGDWRLMLRTLYVPSLVLVAIHWLLPESVRWLYTQDRFEDIEKIFKRMAKMNNTEDKLPSVLSQLHGEKIQDKSPKPTEILEQPLRPNKLKAVFKSRIMMLRLVALATCWIASIFSYYGISQYTTLFKSSNRYLSFLLVSLIEVPAYVASLWLPDWPLLGRQGSTAWSFFLCGVTCFMLTFVSQAQVVLSLVLFLTAKFASTLTLTVLYVYTAEVFPTELRHTLLSFCSMVGRLGSVLSQQTPLISSYFNPMILFSLIAILGGIFTLTCPETLNTTLPDTIEEAEQIGKTQRKRGASVT